MYEEILPKEELTRLKRSFALFDVDGDGTISTKVIYPATQFDGCSQKIKNIWQFSIHSS